jgi:3-phosphoshikimate 1-carboxyvinyltransferase
MRIKLSRKTGSISKLLEMPGDKSIAHRALIIGALGKGQYKVENFPNSMDCLSTLNCMIKAHAMNRTRVV